MSHSTRSLSALDLAFFVLESRERMSNVGPLGIIKPPPGTRSSARYADRLLAQMRKQPVGAPFNLRYVGASLKGLPHLETVAEVDLDLHCHRLTLPAPGTDEQLFATVCRLHEKRVDRSRPPWEFYVIDGLERGRIALYAKVHHGLIDGRGFLEVCTRWFGADPADRKVRALWEGLPVRRSSGAPGVAALAAGAAKATASLYLALVRQTLASAGLTGGLPLPFLGTPAALCAKPSVRRSFAYCVLPLAQMKAFGMEHGASINDVLLTTLDMAMNRYLDEHGRSDTDPPLVADMPVALAKGDGGGNAIAVLQFPLGAAKATPLQRLAQICARTADVKQYVRRTDPAALITYTAAVHAVPALLEALGIERAPMLANMVISNPFGLPERRYLAGAELELALPISVLAPGQSLNITAATYDKGLQIAFLGIAAELPDIQRMADYTVDALAQLVAGIKSRRTRPKAAASKPRGTPQRKNGATRRS